MGASLSPTRRIELAIFSAICTIFMSTISFHLDLTVHAGAGSVGCHERVGRWRTVTALSPPSCGMPRKRPDFAHRGSCRVPLHSASRRRSRSCGALASAVVAVPRNAELTVGCDRLTEVQRLRRVAWMRVENFFEDHRHEKDKKATAMRAFARRQCNSHARGTAEQQGPRGFALKVDA